MTTGRGNSHAPTALRLQNIPIRSALGAKLRAALRPPRSYLWTVDYSDLELRILERYREGFTRRSR